MQSVGDTAFPENTVEKLESQGSYQFDMNDDNGKYGRMHLQDSYNTDDENEEVPCFFLDPDKGCTLSYEDKPFDCKIWPLRIMKKDDEYVIALTPTCPSIGKNRQMSCKSSLMMDLVMLFMIMPKHIHL